MRAAMIRVPRPWLCLLALGFAGSAFGQIPPGGAPKPEPPQIPSAPTTPPSSFELRVPPAPPAPLTLRSPVFVKAFRISGSKTVPEAELAAVLAQWTGREVSAEDLTRAAEAVTAYLRGKGLLVAQAYFPAQEIRDGVAELAVIEGRIGAVRLDVADDSRVPRSVAEWFLGPLRPGETIRRDNVEHSLLLLNDLPGVRLSASLAPAPQPGTADVLARLQNEGNAVTGRFTLDNAGIRGIGEYRGILDLRAPSPLGIGDLLAVRLLRSSEGGQTLGSLTYGLPVNGMGTRIGARYTEQRYKLGREFAALEANGDSRATSVLASHPLIRRSDHNLTAAFSYTELEFQDRVDAVGSVSDSRQRVSGIGLAADARDSWLGGGASALQVQYLRGRVLLDTPALAALDAAPGGLGVNGNFSLWRLRAQRAQAIDSSSSLLISVNGQLASKNLDAGNELAVGGPDAVRAYPVGELYADEGYVARIEYRRRFLPFDVPIALSLFFDGSQVQVNRNALPGDTENRRSLSGYGFGLYHAPGRDIALQTWFAWRSSKDQPTAAPDRSPRIWATLAVQF